MGTTLPGTFLTVNETGDIQGETINRITNNDNYKAIVDNYNNYPLWWSKTESVLKQSSSIATETGFALLYSAFREGGGFDRCTYLFTSCPASFKSFKIWALYQSAQEAELEFLEDCKTPHNEEVLTGAFLKTLSLVSKSIQGRYEKHLSATNSEINVKKLELQVQNRERVTGGDYALLFEWRDENDALKICPIIFQAKRVARIEADLSQQNIKSGRQFDMLSRSTSNPVYIFYNCDTTSTIEMPRLPVVKKVEDINFEKGVYKTSSVEDVVSFSSFILDVMSSDSFFSTESRRVALNEILSGADELQLSSIVTFSVDSSALLEYKKEYKNHLSRINTPRNDGGGDFTP